MLTAVSSNICCDILLMLMHINLTVLGSTNICFTIIDASFLIFCLVCLFCYIHTQTDYYKNYISCLISNFLSSTVTKYYKSRSTFDWVITKNQMVTYFETHCEWSDHQLPEAVRKEFRRKLREIYRLSLYFNSMLQSN